MGLGGEGTISGASVGVVERLLAVGMEGAVKQSWRWFGPRDQVSLAEIRQAGADGIVTALHHIEAGQVWTSEEIRRRTSEVESGGFKWIVAESLPVSEDIKLQTGEWRTHIENYKASLANLADANIHIICYNFMPVLDWTRTDLSHELPNGARCMRFDNLDFAAFDLFILKRSTCDYSQETRERAEHRFAAMDDQARKGLTETILCGLPGAVGGYTLDDLDHYLAAYAGFDEQRLRDNLIAFLEMVVPCAQAHGLRLCCHPDDPPRPLLGLPRIMSTESHLRDVLEAVDRPANGLTFCTGSLAARGDNDLPGMIERLGERIHFLHLRDVVRESDRIDGSFHESAHLDGDTDMVACIHAILMEEARRRRAGRRDASIPFRPDHGHDILDDVNRSAQPGYPAIGRLKGLAELRGVIAGLEFGGR